MAMNFDIMSPVTTLVDPNEAKVNTEGLRLIVGDCVLAVTAGPFKNKELLWLCLGNYVSNGMNDNKVFQDSMITHNYNTEVK